MSWRQADTAHLSSSSGVTEPATTASLREKNTSSNGHKLFLSLPCVTYLQDGQGKCAKDNKKLYLWIYLLYLFGFRFFPCSQMIKEQSLCICITSLYNNLTISGLCLFSSCFWTAAGEKLMLACSSYVIGTKTCNSLLFSGEFASQ